MRLFIYFIVSYFCLPLVYGQESVARGYYDAGLKAFELKNWDEAAKLFKSAVVEADKLKLNNLLLGESLYNLTTSLTNARKFDEALPYAIRSADYYRDNTTGYSIERIGAAKMLADCYAEAKKFDKAAPFYEWVVSAVEESGLEKQRLAYLNYRVGECRSALKDWKESEAAYRKAHKLFLAQDLHGAAGDSLLGIAAIFSATKDDDGAIKAYTDAIDEYKIYAKENKAGIYWLVKSFNDLIAIRDRQKKTEQANELREQLESSLSKFGTAGRKELAKSRYSRADADYDAGRMKEAKEAIIKAIETYDDLGEDLEHYAYSYALLAKIYNQEKKYDEARKNYAKAIRVAEDFRKPILSMQSWIRCRAGNFEREQKDYTKAAAHFETAIKELESEENKLAILTPMTDLYSLYVELKDWKKALEIVNRQIERVEKVKGEEAVELVSPLQRIAYVREETKETALAEKALKRIISIRQSTGKPSDSDVFASVERLARFYQRDKRPDAADALLRKTVSSWESQYGAESGEVAVALKGLASFLAESGKYDEAEKLFRRSIANREKSDGMNARPTAVALEDLADLFHELGRQSEAEPLYRRALKIFETADGSRSKSVASVLSGLCWVCIRQNRHEEALPYGKKALSISEELGEAVSTIARGYNSLGVSMMDLRRYDEAEPLLKKALNLYEESGSEVYGQATVLHNLNIVCNQTNRPEEAETYCRKSIALKEKIGIEDTDRLTTKLNRAGNLSRAYQSLCGLLLAKDKKAEAEAAAQKALEIREKYLGGEHPDAVSSLIQIANIRASKGQYAEREALYTRAAAIRTKIYAATDDIHLANNLTEAAVLHRYHGRFAEADTAYRKATAMYEKHYDGNAAFLNGIWETRAAFLTSIMQYDDAHKLLKKVLDYYSKSETDSTSHAAAMIAMADYEYAIGEFESARKRETAAEKIYRKAYGREHPYLRFLIARKCDNDLRDGDYPAARKYFEAEVARLAKDDPKSPAHASAILALAQFEISDGHPAEAVELLKPVLEMQEKFHGADPYFSRGALAAFALAQFELKKYREAETAERAVYESELKHIGDDSPVSAWSALQLGRILVAQGNINEGTKLINSAFKRFKEVILEADPDWSIIYQVQAEAAVAKKDDAEAIKLYQRAIKIRDAKYPADHPVTRKFLNQYVTYLKANNKSEDLKKIEERLGNKK